MKHKIHSYILTVNRAQYSRTRGVPSHLIGGSAGVHDDNSSDNSAPLTTGGGPNDEHRLTDTAAGTTATATACSTDLLNSGPDVVDHKLIPPDCYQHIDIDDTNASTTPEPLAAIEFAPPPLGAPRPENSARLRRYRLNVD